MPRDVLLSIIIPVYNSGMYIEDCLKSVMTQQGCFYEIVLVNDGSTDCTTEICRRWAETCHNIVYIEQENQGQGTARNVAIEHASGEWLVFLDADDVMLPGALNRLERNIGETYDILVYGSVFVSRDQALSWRQIPPCTKDKNRIMKEMVSVLWDKMIRKAYWEKEGIRLSNVYGEDVCPVYLLEAQAERIGTLQLPLMCHFDRADNLSSNPQQIIQIIQTLTDTIGAFYERDLFERYKETLFFMLLNHHKHYYRLWRINHQQEEKAITEALEKLAAQYFPEEYLKLFDAEKESLVIIGRVGRPFPAELEARDIYYYPCMEQYLLDENKRYDTICHYIVNVENETRAVIGNTRTMEWALSYWHMQCTEMLEVKKERRLKGSIFLYCPETHRNETVKQFEEAAQNIWDCERLERLEDFWKYAKVQDGKRMAGQDKMTEKVIRPVQNFNYRGEYLRLDYNVSLLCSWLRLSQRGIKLDTYFNQHGYENVGIYGIGYLGRLLLKELEDSSVNVVFLIDRNRNEETRYPTYLPEDMLPAVDVVVVSVVHQYDLIRMQMKCVCPVISLQESVDWCVKEADRRGEEGL